MVDSWRCGLRVLGNTSVIVVLCLDELHLEHDLASGPVQERLPSEHGGEELGDRHEHLLHRCVGAKEPEEAAPGVNGLWKMAALENLSCQAQSLNSASKC